MPGNTLLIGNAPNRLLTDAQSWSAVINRLAIDSGLHSIAAGSQDKPFTLMFEEIALSSARRGVREDALKEQLAAGMVSMAPNWLHERLMRLRARHVLTTNYDYCLEASVMAHAPRVDLHSETRYSLFRCRETPAKRVWHIHGELDKPATIMLGHHQYVGYLHKTRNYLTTLGAKSRQNKYDYRSPLLHGRYDCENDPEGYSWVDVFLRDHIHIVGFGLDYSEIGLWWLLGYKERLRMLDQRLPKNVNVGRTHFYCFDDEASGTFAGRVEILRAMGVHVVSVHKPGAYSQGWKNMLKHLEAAL